MRVKVKYRSPLLKVLVPGFSIFAITGIILYCGFTYLEISGILLSIAFGAATLFAVTGAVIILNPLIGSMADLPTGIIEMEDETVTWTAGFTKGEISLEKPHIAEIYTGAAVTGSSDENRGAGLTLQNENSAISIAVTGLEADDILTVIEDVEFTRPRPLLRGRPFFPFRLSAAGKERVEFFAILSALWKNRKNNLAYISYKKFPWQHHILHKNKYAEILDPSIRKEAALIKRTKKKCFFEYREKLFASPDSILVELDISMPANDSDQSIPFYCLMPVGCTEACMESEYNPETQAGSIIKLGLHSLDEEGHDIKALLDWPEKTNLNIEYLDVENLMKYLTLKKTAGEYNCG